MNLKKYVAYLRVPTEKNQGADGNGIAAQILSTQRHASDTGGITIASYMEVESGAKHHIGNRPQQQAALAHAKRAKALLLMAKLDPLSRSVLVTSQLLAANVDFDMRNPLR